MCTVALYLLTIRGSDIFVVMLFPAIIALLAQEESWVSHALGTSIPYYLGILSYSIYLVQILAARLPLERWLSEQGLSGAGIVYFLVLLPIVGVAAVSCYFFIERPGRYIVRALAEGGIGALAVTAVKMEPAS